jgi:protein O-GlcNAc transferase
MNRPTFNLISPHEVTRSFNGGRFWEVEAYCKEVLAQAPETAWAWHFLGRLPALDAEAAIDFLTTALSLSCDNVEILCDLSRVYGRSGHLDLAVERAQQAVALQPDGAPALIALAEAHALAGQSDAAWPRWERAVVLAPSSFAAQLAYGQGLQRRGRSKDALKHLIRASALEPKNLEALFLLGKCYAAVGRSDLALHSFTRANEINPEEAWVWYEGARCLWTAGHVAKALQWIQEAIQCDGAQVEFYELRAECYLSNGEFDRASEAISIVQKRGVMGSKSHEILAKIHQYRANFPAALHHYAKAIELEPNNWIYLSNYASLCIKLGHTTLALEVFDNVLLLVPNCVPVLMNKAIVLRGRLRAREALALMDRAWSLSEEPGASKFDLVGRGDPMAINYLYSHLFVAGLDAKVIFERHRAWGLTQLKRTAPAYNHASVKRDRSIKIKIGYISSDLRLHSVAAFMCPIFQHHDLDEFDVYVYFGSVNGDFVSDRIKSQVTVWRDVASLPDRDIAKLIHGDQIDVLVDLSGHTQGNFLEVCALKPAPIQVSYLGYPCTTGLKAIDYRLTDDWADPIGATEHLYTEKLLRLPDCAWCFGPIIARGLVVETPPVCARGFVTFVCLNNLAKINDFMLDLWAQILKQVPGSKILFKDKNFSDTDFLRDFTERFMDRDVAADRLITLNWRPSPQDHLAVYNAADIALDCFPYNGTTTTCEALASGIPVVSLVGDTHISRVGLSLLKAVDLSDLAISKPDDYVATAVSLAGDIKRLKDLRVNLPIKMKNSVLGDGRGFARKLEECYRNMVSAYDKKLS